MIIGLAIAALLVAAIGVVARSWVLLLLAGIMTSPLAWYLSMTPRFRGIGWLLVVPPVVAAGFVAWKRWVAGWLVAAFAVEFVLLIAVVGGRL